MSFRLFGRRPGASEILPTVTTINQLTYDIADAMQIGPLKGVCAILGRILDTAQKVQGNRDSCLRLTRRATTFILNVRDRMHGKWDSAPQGVKDAVDDFEALLCSISDFMKQLVKAGLFTRIIKQGRIRDAIAEFDQRLNDTIFLFQNSVLLEFHHVYQQSVVVRETTLVEQIQAMHLRIEEGFARGLTPSDEDGFPLVHRSNIVLHGMAPSASGWWCDLEEASVNGKEVLIKRYKGRDAKKRRRDDVAFLKSIWNARFPQLYGLSQASTTNQFILLHNVGIQDIRAFVTPYLQQGHLLEVAAIATRVAEHLRAGLKMLSSSGRWPAIYDRTDEPSVALLSSLVVNSRGNIVIGGDIASETQMNNHRGPLVWLCHEIFGERYPGSLLDVHENDGSRRARQLANQIAGSILLSGSESPAQVSETLLLDFRDSDWTPVILRELRASMASWGLDDRGGLFSDCTYGDVGYLVGSAESTSRRRFTNIGNLAETLGPLHAKLLGEDEPFRRRRMEGHAFQGTFEDMVSSKISPDIIRFTFHKPSSVSYEHQFSVHEKPKDDPVKKTARWKNLVRLVSHCAQKGDVSPDKLILITGHRTSAMLSATFDAEAAGILPPPELHFFLSYEDYKDSYWSSDREYRPRRLRKVIRQPGACVSARNVYVAVLLC
ncbi:hypothetical protein DENSPDRAFT_524588 [Dentipellis sp. KUC8613]|nr:hypothetical protein DENSPDRAFT_524588 [Dentipellis sp. KUC8613]